MAGDGVRIEIYARLVNSGYWWWLNVQGQLDVIGRRGVPAIIPPPRPAFLWETRALDTRKNSFRLFPTSLPFSFPLVAE